MKRRVWMMGCAAALAILGLFVSACRNPAGMVDVSTGARGAGNAPVVSAEPGDLIAGRTTPVGRVVVTNDAEHLSVKYNLDAGWRMTESHLAVATEAAGIPQTKTHNPIPGKFAHSASHQPGVTEYTYVLALGDLASAPGAALFIAAHAEVQRIDEAGNVIQQESAWAAGTRFGGENWATYFAYQPTFGHSVMYDANGATSGSVPSDPAKYQTGDSVIVLGNSGGLARGGYAFRGWNAQADGGGTTWAAGQTFAMGPTDVTLYARWEMVQPPVELAGYWDLTITVGDQQYPPMLLFIRQSGTRLSGAMTGGYLSGSVEGSNFVLTFPEPEPTVTFNGKVSGGVVGGTAHAGEVEGTFGMVPSTSHFGHLDLQGSYMETQFSPVNTEHALAELKREGTSSVLYVSLWDDTQSLSLFFNSNGGFAMGDNSVHVDLQLSPRGQPPIGGETPSTGNLHITSLSTTRIAGEYSVSFSDGGTIWGSIDVVFEEAEPDALVGTWVITEETFNGTALPIGSGPMDWNGTFVMLADLSLTLSGSGGGTPYGGTGTWSRNGPDYTLVVLYSGNVDPVTITGSLAVDNTTFSGSGSGTMGGYPFTVDLTLAKQ